MSNHRTRTGAGLLFGLACLSAAPAYYDVVRATPRAAQEQDSEATGQEAAEEEGWIALFNGRDLEGWTPKIRTFALGENHAQTFRVEDGLLKVGYEDYEGAFGARFGHLFWKQPYEHYRLRVEYRFVGEQAEGGPGWAWRNSGVMLHCQDPASMTVEQEFPVSIEAQMLGGGAEGERTTGNLCTPGTHVEMGGELVTRHCVNSSSKTYRGDDWVTLELEVRGHESIRHLHGDAVVLEYEAPQLDPNDADAKRLIEAGADLALGGGYIALQSESHPLEFRKVELLPLEVPAVQDEAPAEDKR